MDERIESLARLIVEFGANVQPGQIVDVGVDLGERGVADRADRPAEAGRAEERIVGVERGGVDVEVVVDDECDDAVVAREPLDELLCARRQMLEIADEINAMSGPRDACEVLECAFHRSGIRARQCA